MEKSIKQTIIDDSEGLIKRIQICNSYQRIYKMLCDSLNDYPDVYEEFPAFIGISSKAIKISLMLELIKLFDKNDPTKPENDVCSMVELIYKCRKNQSIFPDEYNIGEIFREAETKIKTLYTPIQNLKKRRNKIIAHNDYKRFFEIKNFENDFPLKWRDIESLLALCSSALCKINSALTNQSYLPYYQNDDDVIKLIESAHIGLIMRAEYIKKKIENINLLNE